jgi:hypothetical protein
VTALVLAAASSVHAQSTCNAFISISYVSGPAFAVQGDIVRVRLTLGSGGIQNGTLVNINRVRFDLDCSADGPLGTGCTDDGAVIEYRGDGTITTTCGVGFATGHPIATAPNQVVFTPAAPIPIPANTPQFCSLEFDVRLAAGASGDSTPQLVEQVGGFLAATSDARCNNNLSSAGSQSASIVLCPACDDGNACTTDVCDQDTGRCVNTEKSCDDGNACTTDRCEPTTGQCVNTNTCGGGEGCTPGYWKQSQHFGSYTPPLRPTTLFSAVFENAFPGKTLVQVLSQGGGGLNALGRHTVAALLNAASSGVSFELSTADVISRFNAVFPGANYERLKNEFERLNERRCPLGRNP